MRQGSRRQGLLDGSQVLMLLDRYPGRRGCRRLRGLFEGSEPVPERTRSELERRMYRLCRQARIQCPRMNQWIETSEGPFEVDCVWFAQRLIIECDSRWHDNPVSATRDALRDQALTLCGWRVHRIRWQQVVNAPEGAARTIRLLLEQQERLLRAA